MPSSRQWHRPAGRIRKRASLPAFVTKVCSRNLVAYLEKAGAALAAAIPHEMLLLDLYAALRPIDAITGATTADDILNRIFSTFCIGK